MLEVTIYPDAAALGNADGEGGIVFEEEYVSLVNDQTYGAPALIFGPVASQRTHGDATRARIGERVLYINTHLIPAFEIIRKSE